MASRNRNDKSDWGDHWKKIGTGNVNPSMKSKLDKLLERFAASSSTELTFSKELTSADRAYIHRTAARIGWKSCSNGVAADRCITVSKPKEDNSCSEILNLKQTSLKYVEELQTRWGLDINADNIISSMATHDKPRPKVLKDGKGVEKLGYGPPKVPAAKSKKADVYCKYRQELPIWKHRKEICDYIKDSTVTFVKGDTGCGKTTQVAQYILDEAHVESRPVRVICTVPRRLAAISISERVAVERGETLGSTVGYQIRLEKRLSLTETLLTYCTAGILLRSITSPDSTLLKNLTHIIIDEVHERDRYTDFLMSCLKIMMKNYPNLRLILMGADLNVELFTNYFGGTFHCPVIHVQGRTYPVDTSFLENILEFVDMISEDNPGKVANKQNPRNSNTSKNKRAVTKLTNGKIPDSDWEEFLVQLDSIPVNVNYLIENVFKSGDQDSFDLFVDLVMKRIISVDSKHSDPASDITMLMALAAYGDFHRVNNLLQMGANVSIRSTGQFPYTAKEWAEQYEHMEIVRLLDSKEQSFVDEKTTKKLNEYLKDLDTDKVDLLLASKIIQKIHNSDNKKNSILVFLPGYEDIVTLHNIITSDDYGGFDDHHYQVHMLHSNIQTGDQRAVFERPRRGIRKIILSTNIAETSLTIEDIVHVIDSGKVKEKSYDVITGITQLKSVWISKASSNQRKGRAGRCQAGKCYRLYSTEQYNSMEEFPTPEIIRTNLHELCLSSRSFLTSDYTIEYFFSLIPQPPAPIAVKKAVQELICMGALDKDEFLTDLGIHLVDFPVEPRLGKALIYSIVFKCLNPVLTIVSALSHKDPFQLPSNPALKTQAYEIKRQFAEDSFSDHRALLSLYKKWEEEIVRGWSDESSFCKSNFVSVSSLKMISGIRSQLLSQVKTSGFIKTSMDLEDLNVNQNNWTVVKAVLTAMLYPSLCCVRSNKHCLFNCNEAKIMFHKSTTVHTRKNNWTTDLPLKWVLYDEMTKVGPVSSVRGCTMISTAMVSLLAANFTVPIINEGQMMKIDEWLTITTSEEILSIVLKFRNYLDNLVVAKLKDPGYKFSKEESAVITTIVKILTEEEGLIQPSTSSSSSSGLGNYHQRTKENVARSLLRPFTALPNLVHFRGNVSIVTNK